VVANIKDATDNHLDVLICSHEHWDHNSGFLQHQAVFDRMKIDNVWLAWTENPRIRLAADLKKEYQEKRRKLAMALNRLRGIDESLAARVEGLAAAGGVRAEPAKAMKWVHDLGKNGSVRTFCAPGEVLPIPGTKEARAFILGPPKSRKQLRKNLATEKETEAGDVYHLRVSNAAADAAFFAAAEHSGKSADELRKMSADEREQYELSLPFDGAHHVRPDDAEAMKAFADYFNGVDNWRRIDGDWLATAAQIALWMDSSTNNTSLVLAIEMLPSKKVLLFPADAQVGNWKSWREVEFEAPHDDVDADDLLARTVLYKVGHHGSHNATLRRDGLEKMTHDELAAMIPVNRASVEKKKWRMPFKPMYLALERATQGRIIRADEGVLARPKGFPVQPHKVFESRCHEDPVYVQYCVS
jgi:hypothetical protein